MGPEANAVSEHLVKPFLQTGESVYEDMWLEVLAEIEKHLVVPAAKSKLWLVAELPQGLRGPVSPKMDHLVCFLPGAIAIGATGGLTEAEARKLSSWFKRKDQDMKLAREIMKTC